MHILFDNLGSITDLKTKKFWSSKKLNLEINKRVDFFLKFGINNNKKIIIYHGGTPEFFADLFAVWSIGGCAICINSNLTIPELKNIVSFTKPEMILCKDKKNLNKEINFKNLFFLDKDFSKILNKKINKNNLDKIKFNIDQNALILFTSGTTNKPKGVVHTYRSILSRLFLNHFHIPSSDMRNTLCLLPTHFGHGLIGNCLTPLFNGSKLYLSKGSDLEVLSNLSKTIDKYNINFISSVPSMWKIILETSRSPKNKSLKRIHIGSAPLSANLWKKVIKWSKINNVFNMYGITETANWVGGISSMNIKIKDGLIGKIWGGFYAIQKDNGEIVNEGKGEILIQTPSLMKGYFKMISLSKKSLKNGWLHTGDVGYIDKSGNAYLTGRKKYEINKAGIKIHPEDIDFLLEKNPLIIEACAFKIDDILSGENVGVAIKIKKNKKIDISEIKDWCKKYIVQDKIPEKWYVLKDIPKSDRGKVIRDNVAMLCQKNFKPL
tara:strand:- start:47295 stop:48773 length:1479 start_codon:yes stop_codon:yes gene_type:complete